MYILLCTWQSSPLHCLAVFCISERRSWANNHRGTRPRCWVAWCQLWPFWNFAKGKNPRPSRGYKTSPYFWERGGGIVLKVLACCASLLPGKENKETLFYFLQTLSLYLYLALADREPRFWQHSYWMPTLWQSLLTFQWEKQTINKLVKYDNWYCWWI